MDRLTFGLVLTKFNQLCQNGVQSLRGVREDPTRKDGLIFQTADYGDIVGGVREENDNFVFQFGAQEIVLPKSTFLGRPQ